MGGDGVKSISGMSVMSSFDNKLASNFNSTHFNQSAMTQFGFGNKNNNNNYNNKL